MENTYTINLDAILDLASRKKNLWLGLSEDGDKSLADTYWSEYFGILLTLEIITGKSFTEAMDMVWEWDRSHKN